MKTTEDTAHGQPQVGTTARLERLLADKTALETRIDATLEKVFPQGKVVAYKTWNMKHERCGVVSGAGLYCGSAYVTIIPDHNRKILRRVYWEHVTAL